MPDVLKAIEKTGPIESSAPCRIDMGGTLDLQTLYFPLRHLSPCTFNIALDLRTRVLLRPNDNRRVRISSTGFHTAEYPIDEAPFDQPLGLLFLVAAYFRAEGVHIDIQSASPPRSALGGSSAAVVALIAAFCAALGQKISRRQCALLAHALESSVAGVPCGIQDQLAAVYGGVHAWYWPGEPQIGFRRRALLSGRAVSRLERNLLVAYCGEPHVSSDLNGRWVSRFLSGQTRPMWTEIALSTRRFVDALAGGDLPAAASEMNRETGIRMEMTPDVLDPVGMKLFDSARNSRCGARFCGAGGGGCLWALGESDDIAKLKRTWEDILAKRKEAALLDARIDRRGVVCSHDR